VTRHPVTGPPSAEEFEGTRQASSAPPPLRPLEFARWAWRQLTSMRVALILLFLLALGAIPGSILPQRRANPVAVTDYLREHPSLGPWYDRLGLFDVYASPWFAAIYLLLFVSLVGCIVPRSRQHWKAMRARPPRAPRNLQRLPEYRRLEMAATPTESLELARAAVRRGRYRVDVHDDHLAAERGHLRETGNLVFHLALVVILVAVALGDLWGYRAQVLVPQGSSFANTVIQYDSLSGGARFDAGSLTPFALQLDRFTMKFRDTSPQFAAPENYEAFVTVTESPGAKPVARTIRVNHPLNVDGTLVHILNPGYAPQITVRDAADQVVFSGAVPFLPQDDNFQSTGVVKVSVPGGEDIGLQGIFLPTAILDAEGGPQSVFPEARNPALFFTAWHGDLGLDDGNPQSVYRLDTTAMTQFQGPDGPYRQALTIGERVDLPDGFGSVMFDGYVPWVNFQISKSPSKSYALVGAVLAILGLLASLFVRRRRLWVRASQGGPGRTVVEIAGLDRGDGGDLRTEVDRIVTELTLSTDAVKEPKLPEPEDVA
jgi:cytochrome c biogenesis protein